MTTVMPPPLSLDTHSSLRDRVVAFLDRNTTVSLATHGSAGLWAASVFYVNEGTQLYFSTRANTRHGRNMLETWRVAGTINDQSPDWTALQGVQFEGTLSPVEDLGERLRVVAAYLRELPFTAAMWNGESDPEVIARAPEPHAFYRITPTRLYFLDNERSPGWRAELPLG